MASPGRQARLQRDLEAITALCSAHQFLQVSTTAESLVLSLTTQSQRTEYTFTFTEDYPENTIVVCSQDAESVSVISKQLTIALHEICEEHGVSLAPAPSEAEESKQQEGKGKEEGKGEEMEVDAAEPQASAGKNLVPPLLNTQISAASSEYTEGSEADMEDFYEDFDAYDTDIAGENTMHPLLERELALVQTEYGHNALETRIHAGIDEMDIFINIDLNTFLDEHTASAWGINVSEPLVILLHIQSMSKYLSRDMEPKVDVFQCVRSRDQSSPPSASYDVSTDRIKVGISSQLRKILQTFVSTRWKQLNVPLVERQMSGKSDGASDRTGADSPTARGPLDVSQDAKLAKLVEMGFPAAEGRDALRQSSGDLEAACDLLGKTPPANSFASGLSSLMSFIPGYKRQESMGAQLEIQEQEDPEAHKKTPGLEKGFLVQVVRYALNRLQSLNEFCVICDEKHVLESGLIKPCVCTRELCVFAFQTLGVMADAAEAIATDADVVDLLIAMANTATHSNRANLILDPYPSLVDPDNINTLALDPQKKNFDVVKAVMKEVVISRQSLLRGRSSNVKQEMDEKHKLAFPLMQWIVATCRAYITLLPQTRQIKSMKTKYQFILISSPPAKELTFQQAKQKNGSTFAFHGSNIENWHSIMRKGLVNASGTKLQLHGAAYGKGIYLSPLSSVSFGYTGYSSYHPKPPAGTEGLAGKMNLRCLALCEVVTSKDLKKSGDIWVCPNSDNVCTRFFFVYDESSSSAVNFDTRQSQCKKEIDHAIAHIRTFKKPRK